jgi:hypothetical protein
MLQLNLFPFSGDGTGTPTLLGSSEIANLNVWGISVPSSENGKRSSLRKVVFCG